jgi:hypothetical protein
MHPDTLGGRMRPMALFGLTTMLNTAACCASLTSISTGQQGNGQVEGPRDTVYGSDDPLRVPTEN